MLHEMEPLYKLIKVSVLSPSLAQNSIFKKHAPPSLSPRTEMWKYKSQPLHMQEMSDFKTRLTVFLQEHGELTSALTVKYTPGLLSQFVELTGNTVRMHLLARHMPYKQIIQLYTLVYATVEVSPVRYYLVHARLIAMPC